MVSLLIGVAAGSAAGFGAASLGASTLGAIATGVLSGAQAAQGVQAFQAGQLQAKQLKQTADLERAKAGIQESQQRKKTRRLIAQQVTQFSKSGVVASIGTPLDVIAETAFEEELQALGIRFSGEARARELIGRASIARQAGTQALVGGLISAGTTFLTSPAIPRSSSVVRFA